MHCTHTHTHNDCSRNWVLILIVKLGWKNCEKKVFSLALKDDRVEQCLRSKLCLLSVNILILQKWLLMRKHVMLQCFRFPTPQYSVPTRPFSSCEQVRLVLPLVLSRSPYLKGEPLFLRVGIPVVICIVMIIIIKTTGHSYSTYLAAQCVFQCSLDEGEKIWLI